MRNNFTNRIKQKNNQHIIKRLSVRVHTMWVSLSNAAVIDLSIVAPCVVQQKRTASPHRTGPNMTQTVKRYKH